MRKLTELEQINMLMKHASRNGLKINGFYTHENRTDMGESYAHTVFADCSTVENGIIVAAYFTCACFIDEFDYKFTCVK